MPDLSFKVVGAYYLSLYLSNIQNLRGLNHTLVEQLLKLDFSNEPDICSSRLKRSNFEYLGIKLSSCLFSPQN